MQCYETGKHPVIRLPHVPLDLAEQLNNLLGVLQEQGHGNGQLTLQVTNGHVSYIDCSTRIHRNPSLRRTRLRAL